MSKKLKILLLFLLIVMGLFIVVKVFRNDKDHIYTGNFQLDSQYILRSHETDQVFVVKLLSEQITVIQEINEKDQVVNSINGSWEKSPNSVLIKTEPTEFTRMNQLLITIKFDEGFPYEIEMSDSYEDFRLDLTDFTLGSSDTSILIRELKRKLGKLVYINYDYLEAIETEEYDELTRKAVIDFQLSQKLEPYGVVDYATWTALSEPELFPTVTPIPTVIPTKKPTSPHEQEKVLYFTFDDGPHDTFSLQIIDVLDKYNAKATFFVLGDEVVKNKEILRAEAEAGHYIANHSRTHSNLAGVTKERLAEEIEFTDKVIIETLGDLVNGDSELKYYRPPYGSVDTNTSKWAEGFGYNVVLWDIDPQDWRRPGKSQIADHIIKNAKPDAIILLHDGGKDRTQTVIALEIALNVLSKEGYKFETIDYKYNK